MKSAMVDIDQQSINFAEASVRAAHAEHQTIPAANGAGRVLSIKNLSVVFTRMEDGGCATRIVAVRQLNLELNAAEIVAVVGASGAGKSVLAHAILGILPKNAEIGGDILFKGSLLDERQWKQVRGRDIALVPQSVSFLDPLVKVKHAVYWAARRSGMNKKEALDAQQRAFLRVGLEEEDGNRYPFQLSGGMTRRVLLAAAIVSNAAMLVADEPTPGLHPQAVQESLRQLRQLADGGKTVLLITHDIHAGLSVADRVAVFLDGTIVEVTSAAAFRNNGEQLVHRYSRALWNALPQNKFEAPLADSFLTAQGCAL